MRWILILVSCLSIVTTSLCAEPIKRMPTLRGLVLLHPENREVKAGGRIIKWSDYALTANGSPFFRAVYVSCDHILQPPPFLIHNLFTDTVSIDLDGDGRVDQTLQSPSSYDPADFFLKLPADRKCENTIISQAAPTGAAILFQIFFLLQLFRQITFFVIFFVAFAVSQLFHQFSRCIPNMERNRKVT